MWVFIKKRGVGRWGLWRGQKVLNRFQGVRIREEHLKWKRLFWFLIEWKHLWIKPGLNIAIYHQQYAIYIAFSKEFYLKNVKHFFIWEFFVLLHNNKQESFSFRSCAFLTNDICPYFIHLWLIYDSGKCYMGLSSDRETDLATNCEMHRAELQLSEWREEYTVENVWSGISAECGLAQSCCCGTTTVNHCSLCLYSAHSLHAFGLRNIVNTLLLKSQAVMWLCFAHLSG